MSANNWRVCPRCSKNELALAEQQEKEVGEAYGKVSEEKYIDLLNRANSSGHIDTENLREDWQLGTAIDGTFFVEYRCSCNVCGFDFSYEHSEQVKL